LLLYHLRQVEWSPTLKERLSSGVSLLFTVTVHLSYTSVSHLRRCLFHRLIREVQPCLELTSILHQAVCSRCEQVAEGAESPCQRSGRGLVPLSFMTRHKIPEQSHDFACLGCDDVPCDHRTHDDRLSITTGATRDQPETPSQHLK
jgi:hypothetical protein